MEIALTKEQIQGLLNGGVVYLDIDEILENRYGDEQWHTLECEIFMNDTEAIK